MYKIRHSGMDSSNLAGMTAIFSTRRLFIVNLYLKTYAHLLTKHIVRVDANDAHPIIGTTNDTIKRTYIMIKDDIINELQYIPESRLTEIYDIVHYFRLKFNSETPKQGIQKNLAGCLQEYTNGYIPTDDAIQQAWEATVNEKYHRS
jgi:hypothetical protein